MVYAKEPPNNHKIRGIRARRNAFGERGEDSTEGTRMGSRSRRPDRHGAAGAHPIDPRTASGRSRPALLNSSTAPLRRREIVPLKGSPPGWRGPIPGLDSS